MASDDMMQCPVCRHQAHASTIKDKVDAHAAEQALLLASYATSLQVQRQFYGSFRRALTAFIAEPYSPRATRDLLRGIGDMEKLIPEPAAAEAADGE